MMGQCLITRRGGAINLENLNAAVKPLTVGVGGNAPATYAYDSTKQYLLIVLVYDSYSTWSWCECSFYALKGDSLVEKGRLHAQVASGDKYTANVTASNGTITVTPVISGGDNKRYCGAIFCEI